MVTVFLRGGLGNQMFQYALGLSLARENNTQLVLDTTYLNDRFPRREMLYRTFDLDIFNLTDGVGSAPNFTTLSKISSAVPIPGVWLGIDVVLIQLGNVFGVCSFIKEKSESQFDAHVLQAKGNILLWGRWQSEKYFSNWQDVVRNAFRFKDTLNGEAAEITKEIEESSSVSLHVRRGDYVNFKAVKKIMGKTNTSYYGAAVGYIAQRVDHPHFFVFSDDIAWCREHIKPPFPTTYLDEATQGPKSSFHLRLMSLCKHNIIANSTFSWWGAWLNTHPDKIVIAPKRWYHNGNDDIVPEAWIKI